MGNRHKSSAEFRAEDPGDPGDQSLLDDDGPTAPAEIAGYDHSPPNFNRFVARKDVPAAKC